LGYIFYCVIINKIENQYLFKPDHFSIVFDIFMAA